MEYLGNRSKADGQPHGNARCSDDVLATPYIRIPSATIEAVSEAVKTQRPKDVYNSMIQSMSVDDAPRNERSVRDIKYRQQKKPKSADKEYR